MPAAKTKPGYGRIGEKGVAMAIYHCSVDIIGRSKGHSSTAAAAYRAGGKIKDERTGELHDYSRKQNCAANGIVLPEGAPAEFADREKLWNAVEKTEKRSDAQLCRSFDMALPNEMPEDLQEQLIQEFCQEQFADHGIISDWSIHRPKPKKGESKNDHVHVLTTMRDVDEHGFGKKNRSWNDQSMVQKWRKAWAEKVNEYIDRYQISENHIDHRSLKDQGIDDRLPQKHLGKAAHAMEQRGERTDRGNHNREIQVMNGNMEANKEYLRKYAMGVIEHNRRAAENIESTRPYWKHQKMQQALAEQLPGHRRMLEYNKKIIELIVGSGLLSEKECTEISHRSEEIAKKMDKVIEGMDESIKSQERAFTGVTEVNNKLSLEDIIRNGEKMQRETAEQLHKAKVESMIAKLQSADEFSIPGWEKRGNNGAYAISAFRPDGTRRSLMEELLILAATVIQGEVPEFALPEWQRSHGDAVKPVKFDDFELPCSARVDNLHLALQYMEELDIEDIDDLEEMLKRKDLSPEIRKKLEFLRDQLQLSMNKDYCFGRTPDVKGLQMPTMPTISSMVRKFLKDSAELAIKVTKEAQNDSPDR